MNYFNKILLYSPVGLILFKVSSCACADDAPSVDSLAENDSLAPAKQNIVAEVASESTPRMSSKIISTKDTKSAQSIANIKIENYSEILVESYRNNVIDPKLFPTSEVKASDVHQDITMPQPSKHSENHCEDPSVAPSNLDYISSSMKVACENLPKAMKNTRNNSSRVGRLPKMMSREPPRTSNSLTPYDINMIPHLSLPPPMIATDTQFQYQLSNPNKWKGSEIFYLPPQIL